MGGKGPFGPARLLQGLVPGLPQHVLHRAHHLDEGSVVGGGGQGKVELGVGVHAGLAFHDLTLLFFQYGRQTIHILSGGSFGGQCGELGLKEVAIGFLLSFWLSGEYIYCSLIVVDSN